mmetsp:Transcript_29270/g.70140  ORF Transcript_29270/g.70140 Transcript_29270/m.70140 type:complete len:344 (-) Transcript_29270:1169-2200(-)
MRHVDAHDHCLALPRDGHGPVDRGWEDLEVLALVHPKVAEFGVNLEHHALHVREDEFALVLCGGESLLCVAARGGDAKDHVPNALDLGVEHAVGSVGALEDDEKLERHAALALCLFLELDHLLFQTLGVSSDRFDQHWFGPGDALLQEAILHVVDEGLDGLAIERAAIGDQDGPRLELRRRVEVCAVVPVACFLHAADGFALRHIDHRDRKHPRVPDDDRFGTDLDLEIHEGLVGVVRGLLLQLRDQSTALVWPLAGVPDHLVRLSRVHLVLGLARDHVGVHQVVERLPLGGPRPEHRHFRDEVDVVCFLEVIDHADGRGDEVHHLLDVHLVRAASQRLEHGC